MPPNTSWCPLHAQNMHNKTQDLCIGIVHHFSLKDIDGFNQG